MYSDAPAAAEKTVEEESLQHFREYPENVLCREDSPMKVGHAHANLHELLARGRIP